MNVIKSLMNRNLRWKIMTSIVSAVLIMGISLLIIARLDQYALDIIGQSYKSNEVINSFSTSLSETELAMENYCNYHTFEGIDRYYGGTIKVQNYISKMQEFPSTDTVKQKEYVVAQLALSFLEYSTKAVSMRRANSDDTSWYIKATDCYKYLLQNISELNIMLMEKNAGNYNKNKENMTHILRAYILFFAGFFIFTLLILNFIIGSITKPLEEISQTALRIADRNFDIPLFNSEATDEIGNICRAFDRMIISIREYIDTIWQKARTENELREREIQMHSLYADAQLKLYQSQINPHFLFNTLNTGAQLAMMEGADKTCYFIEQTSDFFRYNIQQQKKNATIRDELGLVDNFVYIMKVRFGKRLEFIRYIESDNLDKQLPSMILQPLVENCIKHGLQNSTGVVTLTVKDSPDNSFTEISICDNGSGFDEEVRKKILSSGNQAEIQNFLFQDQNSEEHTGIGLINVTSRLKLFFHRNDIFDITAGDDGTGTKFIIRVY